MVYDPGSERMILFGGVHGTFLAEEAFGDTWAYDYAANTWTELDTAAAPSPRGWHAMAYDADSQRIILFGGGPLRQEPTNETWVFDPATDSWTERTTGDP